MRRTEKEAKQGLVHILCQNPQTRNQQYGAIISVEPRQFLRDVRNVHPVQRSAFCSKAQPRNAQTLVMSCTVLVRWPIFRDLSPPTILCLYQHYSHFQQHTSSFSICGQIYCGTFLSIISLVMARWKFVVGTTLYYCRRCKGKVTKGQLRKRSSLGVLLMTLISLIVSS